MSMTLTLFLVVQVLSALSIIVLVLLQQGKGADMGSAFGSGSAGSLFGATGAANFLSRATKWAAIVFFVSTAGLAYLSHNRTTAPVSEGVMQDFDRSVPQVPGAAAPAGDNSVPQVQPAPDNNSVPGVSEQPSVGGEQPAPQEQTAPQNTAEPEQAPAEADQAPAAQQ